MPIFGDYYSSHPSRLFNADLPFSEEPPEDAQSEQLVADVLQPSDDDGASR